MKTLGIWAVLWAVSAGCAHERARDEPVRKTKEPAPAPTTASDTEKTGLDETNAKEARPDAAPTTAKAGADHGLYDGSTGAPVTMPAILASLRNADFIAFGEIHYNEVGNRTQLELLKALAEHERPVALAMEFFERDTQKFVDQYLAGEITEKQFVDRSRQKKKYATSHRPLIQFCKEHNIPVIAANAPRRLVSEYRKLKHDYQEYRESLSDDELLFLPKESTGLNDEEKKRFVRFMGGHGAGQDFAPFMQSMALWDDTMADSVARFRSENPEHRVLLIVGMFHVMNKMGAVRKYVARRPVDNVRTLIMVSSGNDAVTFTESDRGLGDFVLKVAKAAGTTP